MSSAPAGLKLSIHRIFPKGFVLLLTDVYLSLYSVFLRTPALELVIFQCVIMPNIFHPYSLYIFFFKKNCWNTVDSHCCVSFRLALLYGFPGGSDSKKISTCDAGDLGLSPGSGRSPG